MNFMRGCCAFVLCWIVLSAIAGVVIFGFAVMNNGLDIDWVKDLAGSLTIGIILTCIVLLMQRTKRTKNENRRSS